MTTKGPNISRRALMAAASAALLCATAGGVATAQDFSNYPERPIELIIPFAPGGGVDLFGRTVANLLNSEGIVSQNIQVVNTPGAGGAIGMAEMVQRHDDPYSLLGIAIHVHVTPLTLGTEHTFEDMTPIAKLFSEYQMMVVRADSPIQSLQDIEDALREDVGSLRFGGATLGNADHMTVSKLVQEIGGDPADVTYMAYSGGESNAAILGGHVDVGMGGLDLIDLVEGGRMRALAVSSPERLGGAFADIPTFIEQGYDLVNENWRGIFGPPAMPEEVVQYWRDALRQLVETEAWQTQLENNQWVASYEDETFLESLRQDHEVYRDLLTQLNLIQ